MNAESIKAPKNHGSEYARLWERNMAVLASDPRTPEGGNRPRWLVDRVLRDHGIDPRELDNAWGK